MKDNIKVSYQMINSDDDLLAMNNTTKQLSVAGAWFCEENNPEFKVDFDKLKDILLEVSQKQRIIDLSGVKVVKKVTTETFEIIL